MVSPRRVSVQELYASSTQDIRFESLVADQGLLDDDALAELIEADGRARLELGREVDLSRYLAVIPDLASRQVPLDAAIDVSLRWMSASSRPRPDAVDAMVDRFPHLESSIREAATLANAMWSTSGLRSKLEGPRRSVPSEFGPRTDGGRARFELRRLLGAGGWGEVYLAQDRQLSDNGHEALVAIKFLTGLRSGTWERQRLIDEAAKARRVDHPNVARVLDRGVTEHDEDYIVYEFVSGGDLAEWLDKQKSWPELRHGVALIAKVARGVQAAHAAGLVHCDLKPGNILLGSDGEPRVSDFGIAVRSDDAGSDVATGVDGRPAGNLAFIAPEQYRGEDGAFTVAADLYALGGLLYYLATRRLPNGSSVEEIRRTHAREGGRTEPPSLGEGLSWIDRDLDAVCRRAMAVKPSDRYPSAAAFADDLESWLRREPVYWTKPSATRRAALWCRRSPIVAALVVLTIMVGTAAGIASTHWSNVAETKSIQADEAQGLIKAARTMLAGAIVAMQDITAESGSLDALPFAFVWEWMNGPAILGDRDRGFRERWKNRAEIAEQMLASRISRGMGESIDAVMWETVAGLYRLQMGEHAIAEPVLRRALDRWKAKLHDPSDPWIETTQRLVHVAAATRLAAARAVGPLTDEQVKEFDAAYRGMSWVLVSDPKLDASSIVQRLTLRTVVQAADPSLLDWPDDLASAKRRVAGFPPALTLETALPGRFKAKPKSP